MDKRELLDRTGAAGEERLLLAHILDKQTQSQQRNTPAWTNFLSPQEQAAAADLLRAAGVREDSFRFWGGWSDAERQILFFCPDWMDPESVETESPMRYLRASYSSENPPGHRDLLGSLMGLGVTREKMGDILVSPESADLIVLDSIADFLLQNWSSAGRTKLTVSSIERKQMRIPAVRVQEQRDTVSSLRLDAVCAAGFRLSRSRAAELITAGRVQWNWRACTKTDHPVAAGDMISIRGLGRCKLSEVGNRTRKGRIAIVIQRW